MNGTEPDWSEPTVLPTDAQVDLAANPLRPYLLALAADLCHGMATLNWRDDQHVRGEVAAMKRAMALMLVHNYGQDNTDAYGRVEKAAEQQVRGYSVADAGWERTRHGVYERVVANLLDPNWVVPE